MSHIKTKEEKSNKKKSKIQDSNKKCKTMVMKKCGGVGVKNQSRQEP